MPAIERYDGPAYRVLRKYARTYPEDVPDVYVISAQFGLIDGEASIPAYDRRMTSARARELQEQVAAIVHLLDIGRRYEQVFISGGAAYRQVLAQTTLPPSRLTLATGSQGVQLSQLKAWLHEHPKTWAATGRTACDSDTPITFQLRGETYELSLSEVIAVAREGMRNGVNEATKVGAWYVLLDDHKIAPKWLVSQLTGMPVGSFHSDDARRVLRCMGFCARQT